MGMGMAMAGTKLPGYIIVRTMRREWKMWTPEVTMETRKTVTLSTNLT